MLSFQEKLSENEQPDSSAQFPKKGQRKPHCSEISINGNRNFVLTEMESKIEFN